MVRLYILTDSRQRLLGLITTYRGIITRTLAVTHTDLLGVTKRALIQSLAIGVTDHQIDTLNAQIKDMIDSITTRTADADNHNLCRNAVASNLALFKFVV